MEITHGDNLFTLARNSEWDWREVTDLSASINPLGQAPGARQAMLDALERVGYYPEAEPQELVRQLAKRWQVAPGQVLLGNGSTELIHFTARIWAKETATLATPTFGEFHRAHPAANSVPWNEPHNWPDEGIMILTQPNNPIGQTLAPERLERYLLLTKNPVIIDESFIEFSDTKSSIPVIGKRPNLFVLRSLSSFYALPGLRIGALVGDPEHIETLRAKREPWQTNVVAEAAALASLDDIDYAARTRELVAGERGWMWERLRQIPTITPVRSESNFFLIYLSSGAAEIQQWFLDRKILIRNCTGWPGIDGDAIRIAIGRRETNERVTDMLRRYITGS